MDRGRLVIIGGPTASGKSALSIDLAERIGGEVISADSMQVYRGMDIGTAKLKKEDMRGVPHHLIDVLEPDEQYNVLMFKKMALEAMKGIWDRGHIPVITGGTGFYIQAVLRDINFPEEKDSGKLRSKLEERAANEGSAALHRELKRLDPEAAAAIHENNARRIIRALEFYHQTGNRISEHNRQESLRESPFKYAYFALSLPRELLYKRIETRVDEMVVEGLFSEVEELRRRGYDRSLTSMQGLGYKEILSCIEGEISREEAIELVKRNTRRFAKRQLTWLRRERDIITVDMLAGYREERLSFLMDMLTEREIF